MALLTKQNTKTRKLSNNKRKMKNIQNIITNNYNTKETTYKDNTKQKKYNNQNIK